MNNFISAVYEYNLKGTNCAEIRCHYDRCKVRGFNQYTWLRQLGFEIKKSRVSIPLIEDNKIRAKKIQPSPKYITINYGWSCLDKKYGNIHAKVWDFENYEKLILLFKEKYKNVKIVQLGIIGSPKMKNVDRYIFDESVETVKWILKDALLHVDCEGGLVHIATNLGTKCAVLFGPTPIYYFGYIENINIVAGTCHDCYYCYNDFTKCARKLDKSECMELITPELVMKKIEEYLFSIDIEN